MTAMDMFHEYSATKSRGYSLRFSSEGLREACFLVPVCKQACV